MTRTAKRPHPSKSKSHAAHKGHSYRSTQEALISTGVLALLITLTVSTLIVLEVL